MSDLDANGRTAAERILDYLHEHAGRCGHCGTRTCLQRKSWSVLPDKLLTVDVLDAIKKATGEEP